MVPSYKMTKSTPCIHMNQNIYLATKSLYKPPLSYCLTIYSLQITTASVLENIDSQETTYCQVRSLEMVKVVKSTKGRQRIEMKCIQGEEARQVCFSKRRPSLFKKASELSTLCGAEVAVVTFSPGGKCFSFGHPSTSSVTDRFLAVHTLDDGRAMASGSHGSRRGLTDTSHAMNQQLMELQRLMETEKRRKKRAMEAMVRESGGPVMQLLSANVGALGIRELEELRKELCMVENMVKERAREVLRDAMQTRRLPPQSHVHMALPSQVPFGVARGREPCMPISPV